MVTAMVAKVSNPGASSKPSNDATTCGGSSHAEQNLSFDNCVVSRAAQFKNGTCMATPTPATTLAIIRQLEKRMASGLTLAALFSNGVTSFSDSHQFSDTKIINCATAPVTTPIGEDAMFQRTVMSRSDDACQYPVTTRSTESAGGGIRGCCLGGGGGAASKQSHALQPSRTRGHTTKNTTANRKSVHTRLRTQSGVSGLRGT